MQGSSPCKALRLLRASTYTSETLKIEKDKW